MASAIVFGKTEINFSGFCTLWRYGLISENRKSRNIFWKLPLVLAILPLAILGKPVVLNISLKEFSNILPGKAITLKKSYDPATRGLTISSNDASIQSASDLVRAEEADRNAFRAKNGRLDNALVKKLLTLNTLEKIRVVVTLKPPPGISYFNKFDYTEDQLFTNSLAAGNAKPLRNFTQVFSLNGLSGESTVSDYVSILDLSKADLAKLAFDSDIASIEEYKAEKITSLPFARILPALFSQPQPFDNYNTLSRSAYWHSQYSVPNFGNSVHAATFESGITSTFLSCAGKTAYAWDPQPNPFLTNGGGGAAQPGDAAHSNATFLMLALASPGALHC